MQFLNLLGAVGVGLIAQSRPGAAVSGAFDEIAIIGIGLFPHDAEAGEIGRMLQIDGPPLRRVGAAGAPAGRVVTVVGIGRDVVDLIVDFAGGGEGRLVESQIGRLIGASRYCE